MRSVSKHNLQRKLLALGVLAIRDGDQQINIWSTDTVPYHLILEAEHHMLEMYRLVPRLPERTDVEHCDRCGHPCDLLYITGEWKCSSCESVVGSRKQAVLDLLDQI
ncbi:hypothetical protein RBWH47_04988 [Rhodopirellula baltica WH47]|uniref:Uncharacterized protein n=1 Tax=Rhodopirellula baltica WH47 TaxID=991778 RepID=F2AU24_RHOBT|nr:hypothetical protein RBWH47_04988 [Rhodopirellula baltica WH47]